MIEIGRMNQLRISRISDFGCFLDGDDLGEVMLMKSGDSPALRIDATLQVFVYVDSDESVLASLKQPKVLAGECAALQVVSLTASGAYLDWGMTTDLFVPRSELVEAAPVGETVVACAMVDPDNRRMIASTRLYKHLSQTNDSEFSPRQTVDLLICQETDLGFKAIVNGTHLGLLYRSQVFQSLSIGQALKGFISPVLRDDGRIDLELNQVSQTARNDLEGRVLQHLQDHGGVSMITDKSTPDEIYKAFSVSKGAYKKAIGGLYRRKLITLNKKQIRLNRPK